MRKAAAPPFTVQSPVTDKAPPPNPPSLTATPVNVSAAMDPTHADHHISFAQVFGTMLVGLTAYSQAQQQGSGVFLQPSVLANYAAGLQSIWNPATPQF